MIPKKALFCLFFVFLSSIASTSSVLAITYTYYPTYGIVTGTSHNILTITYPVIKLSPDQTKGKTVVGYIQEKKQPFALVLDPERGQNVLVDVESGMRGVMRGEGVEVAERQ